MNKERKAAIDLDDIRDKDLNSISAADFLVALGNAGHVGAAVFRFWPEKKKYELLTEPESGTSVGGLVKFVTEKKKIEIEKDPRPEIHKQHPSEYEWLNPKDLVINPVIAEHISMEVAKQLEGLRR